MQKIVLHTCELVKENKLNEAADALPSIHVDEVLSS